METFSSNPLETGIPGLDYMFNGGFRWIGKRPPAVLVQGPAGSGKSMFCATIAANVYRRGLSVAYFVLEQKATDIKEVLDDFSWGNNIQTMLEANPDKPEEITGEGNLFWIGQYTAALRAADIGNASDARNNYMNYVNERLAKLEKKSRRIGLIVFDSLSDAIAEQALTGASGLDFDLRRSRFLELCSLGMREGCTPCPVVVALETMRETDWREYVADVVIQLGSNTDERDNSRSHRFLRIRKARNQFSSIHEHLMQIRPREGIRIYPNVNEIISRLNEQRFIPEDISDLGKFARRLIDNRPLSLYLLKHLSQPHQNEIREAAENFDKFKNHPNRISELRNVIADLLNSVDESPGYLCEEQPLRDVDLCHEFPPRAPKGSDFHDLPRPWTNRFLLTRAFSEELSWRPQRGGAEEPFSDLKGMAGFMTLKTESETKGILAGSATLLYGHDRTRKNGIAVSFLRLHAASERRVIYLAAGQSLGVAKQMVRSYLLNLYDDLSESAFERIVFVPLDQFGDSLPELVDLLRQTCFDPLRPVSRAVVNDLAGVPQQETVLILRDFFLAAGVTSLFVHTISGKEPSEYRELFDNVIYSRNLVLPDRFSTRIAYRLQKLQATASTSPSWELHEEIQPVGNKRRLKLSLQNTLQEFVEGADGCLHSMPLELMLACPYPELEEHCREIARVVFDTVATGQDNTLDPEAPTLRVFRRNEGDVILESIRKLPPDTVLPKTQVLCFDEPWADELIRHRKLESLDKLIHTSDTLFNKTAMEAATYNGELFALPHHIDLGFYVVWKSLYNRLPAEVQENPTWDSLVAAVRKFKGDLLAEVQKELEDCVRNKRQDEIPSKPHWPREFAAEVSKIRFNLLTYAKEFSVAQGLLPNEFDQKLQAGAPGVAKWMLKELTEKLDKWQWFDCSSNSIEESFLCFILETLKPVFDKQKRGKRDAPPRFSDEDVRQALIQLHRNLSELGAIPIRFPEANLMDKQQDNTLPRAQFKALIQRHWFVSYKRLSRVMPDDFVVLRNPPALQFGNQIYRAQMLRGEWYLGVVRGSPNPMRGALAIQALTGEVANHELYGTGLGLPGREALLKEDNTRRTFLQMYSETWSRRLIPHYHKLRTVLISGIRDIFSSATANKNDIHKITEDMDVALADRFHSEE